MMANSELLRPHEVRDAYRLIGDCRDLGHDPALWHRRMFDGVCRLIGVPAATGGEGRWLRPHRPVEAISTFDSGLDARGRRVLIPHGPVALKSLAGPQGILRGVGRGILGGGGRAESWAPPDIGSALPS